MLDRGQAHGWVVVSAKKNLADRELTKTLEVDLACNVLAQFLANLALELAQLTDLETSFATVIVATSANAVNSALLATSATRCHLEDARLVQSPTVILTELKELLPMVDVSADVKLSVTVAINAHQDPST